MKVLLVKPYNLSDHIQPSLGLGYLAASLRAHHDVRILDCIKDKLTIEKFHGVLRAHNPDVLGIQFYTFDAAFIKEALRVAKEFNSGIVTVVGGPHPSAMPRETMQSLQGCLDFLFAGEAETGLTKLLEELNSGSRDFSGVSGLTWVNNGEIQVNDKVFIEDLDSLSMPAWDLIRPETYPESQHGAFFKKFPIAPIMVTRGCPYPCTFCAGNLVSGKKVRRRSVDNVIQEITLLYDRHGIREFHIIDDNFTHDVRYAKELLSKLKNLNLDISWAVPNGVRMDSLDEEILSLMKDTGLYLISLGIESGSNYVLRKMRKGTTVDRIRKCVKMINDSGIDMAGFFMLGFPGETESMIRETIKFSTELPLVRANYFTYLPFPGSESYRDISADGELEKVDWENFYFMNAAYVPKGLTRKRLKALQRMAFAKFYLRPRIIFYNLRSIKSFRHFLFLVRRFFNWIIRN